MNKVISAKEAAKLIKSNDSLCFTAAGMIGFAEYIASAIEERFLSQSSPKNLTIIHSCACGDGRDKGANHFAHENLTKRLITSHLALSPKFHNLINQNKIEAYLLPQGVITHLFRHNNKNSPGVLTKIGLNTFVDPRFEGGKANEKAKEDLVKLVNIDEEKYLLYKTIPINVALIKATYADTKGNVFFKKEPLLLEALSIAQSAKNNNGIVIVQVEELVEYGKINAKETIIPSSCVDYIVIAPKNIHMQTMGTNYNPVFSGEKRISFKDIPKNNFDAKEVIARRAILELKPNDLVNLGIGIPELISSMALKEEIVDKITLTCDLGIYGGYIANGMDFPASYNFDAMIEHSLQFDFYDGGGVDVAFLGIGQIDENGNCNVSKFDGKIIGPGGFINISQNSKKVVFCGTFTAKGLNFNIINDKINIMNEGQLKKFVKNIEQITFNGRDAANKKQEVIFITERAVFKLRHEGGLELLEIAPGVDLKKDILQQMEFKPYIKDINNISLMPSVIFSENSGDLKRYFLKNQQKGKI